jgi:hypothetical protein
LLRFNYHRVRGKKCAKNRAARLLKLPGGRDMTTVVPGSGQAIHGAGGHIIGTPLIGALQ